MIKKLFLCLLISLINPSILTTAYGNVPLYPPQSFVVVCANTNFESCVMQPASPYFVFSKKYALPGPGTYTFRGGIFTFFLEYNYTSEKGYLFSLRGLDKMIPDVQAPDNLWEGHTFWNSVESKCFSNNAKDCPFFSYKSN